jgi:hypothetical protein
MLLAALPAPDQLVDEQVLRTVGRLNRQRDAGGGVAALLVPQMAGAAISASQQLSLATSVVVIDMDELNRVATNKSPRDAFVAVVLAQADLTKANPFTVTGATSRRMFYGRGAEDALLQNTLATNSAALIGGRRIGKTSLMLHAKERLDDAGWNVWYADCQAVGDWSGFAAHVRTHWDVEASSTFSAAAVEQVFTALARRQKNPLVVMLDEVDNLLRWDRAGGEQPTGMKEPLFRALRSLSQEGTAQFVFSGERLIASVLWDASSPHWNFCRAIPIRQLARDDADALLSTPLAALRVHLVGRAAILDEGWKATSGHPQIVQQLGEMLVDNLNDRPAESRGALHLDNVQSITTSSEFLRHYVYTYWGQATEEERLVTVLLAEGVNTVKPLATALEDSGARRDLSTIETILRMLDLYGIIDDSESQIAWRATRFPEALRALGGTELLKADFVRVLSESL